MFSKLFVMMLLASVVLMLVSLELAQAHEEGQVIVISPKVGEVIDREERDTYQLFQSFPSFQRAQFLKLSDGSYAIHITYLDGKASRTQVWRISRHELVENYQKVVDRPRLTSASGRWDELLKNHPQAMDRSRSRFSMSRRELSSPIVDIETTNGHRLRVVLQGFSGDSIALSGAVETHGTLLQQAVRGESKMNLNDVSRLSLPRKSSFGKGMAWGLIPIGLGTAAGALCSDEGSWLCPSPRSIVMALGVFSGFIVASIGGSIGAMKGVDVDIPWEGRSRAEKQTILSQLETGIYRPRKFLKFSPWVGSISSEQNKAAAVLGGRLRHYLTPRSGLELIYGRTGWFPSGFEYGAPSGSETERSKLSLFSGGCFICLTRNWPVNPFVAWSWGLTSRTSKRWEWEDTQKGISINIHVGAEVPLNHWLSLEGRFGNILALDQGDYDCFQLALNIGPNR